MPWRRHVSPAAGRSVLGWGLPSGKHTKNDGKSPFGIGKSTISMAIFNSYVYYQSVNEMLTTQQ